MSTLESLEKPAAGMGLAFLEKAKAVADQLGTGELEVVDGRVLYHIKNVTCYGVNLGNYTVDINYSNIAKISDSRYSYTNHLAVIPIGWRDDGIVIDAAFHCCHPRIYSHYSSKPRRMELCFDFYSYAWRALVRSVKSEDPLASMDIISRFLNRSHGDEGDVCRTYGVIGSRWPSFLETIKAKPIGVLTACDHCGARHGTSVILTCCECKKNTCNECMSGYGDAFCYRCSCEEC